jgi:hypothetical protein
LDWLKVDEARMEQEEFEGNRSWNGILFRSIVVLEWQMEILWNLPQIINHRSTSKALTPHETPVQNAKKKHDTSKQISTTIPLIWNSIEENSLAKNINFQFIFNQAEHGKPSDNKLHLPEKRSTVSSLFKFKFIKKKRHFMNIYFSYFLTDFPGFLFEFNQKNKKRKIEKNNGIFSSILLSSNKWTKNQIKKLFKGSFFIFQNNFFFNFIRFEEKKTDKKLKLNSEWKFSHIQIFIGNKRKLMKNVLKYEMHFEAEWFLDWYEKSF